MLKLTRSVLWVVSVLTISSVVHADGMKDTKDMKGMNMSQPMEGHAEGTGLIKAIDKAAGTVTISHHPIKAFNWPAMTMVFKVADPKLLDKVAVDNTVQFTVQGKDMMKSTVTALKVIH